MKISLWFLITLTCLPLTSVILAKNTTESKQKGLLEAKQAYESNKQSAELAFNLGYQYQEQSMLEKAKELYERAISLDSRFVAAYINLGNIESLKQNYSIAEEFYNKAIALNPSSAEAYYNLGALYQLQNKTSKALGLFQKTISLDPKHKAAHLNIATAYLILYTSSYQKELLQLAREHLTKAGALDRNYAHVYYNFGMLYELENQPSISLAYYREALRFYKLDSQQYTKTLRRIEYLQNTMKP